MPSERLERTKRLFEGKRAFGVVAIACTIFCLLSVLIRYSFLQGLDLHVTRELQERNMPELVMLMRALTFSGSPAVLPVLALLAACLLWRITLPRAAGLVLLSLAAIPIDILLKLFWDRARPDAGIVNVAVATAGTSFPSGHAMGATAFYGALAALAWVHLNPRGARLPLTLVLVAMPVLIDVSRVYLGAHWLSDVVGGSAVGLLVLIPLVHWYLNGIPHEVADQAEAKASDLGDSAHQARSEARNPLQ